MVRAEHLAQATAWSTRSISRIDLVESFGRSLSSLVSAAQYYCLKAAGETAVATPDLCIFEAQTMHAYWHSDKVNSMHSMGVLAFMIE